METPITASVTDPAVASAVADAPKTAPSLDQIKAERVQEQSEAASKAESDAAQAKVSEALALKEAEQAKAKEAETSTNLKAKLETELAEKAALLPKAELATKLEQAMALAKEGKHLEAIEALELDLDGAVKQLMGMPKEEQNKHLTKGTIDPELAKKEADRDREIADLKQWKEGRIRAEAEQAKADGVKAVIGHVKTEAKSFPFLAKNEDWVKAALLDADKDYADAVKANKGKDIDQDKKESLIETALTRAEKFHTEQAKAYGALTGAKPEPAKTVPKPATTPINESGPGITKAGLVAKPRGKSQSIEDLKAARRAAQN